MVIHFLRYSICDKYGWNQRIIFKITELFVILHHSGSILTCFLTKLCSIESVYSLFLTKTFYREYAHFWALLVAQMVKIWPAMWETWVWSLGGEDPLEKEWQPTPVFLPGEFYGQRSLVGYSPWGHKESDMAEWLTHTHTHTHTEVLISVSDKNLRCKAFKDKVRKVWWRKRQNQTSFYESRKRTQMA